MKVGPAARKKKHKLGRIQDKKSRSTQKNIDSLLFASGTMGFYNKVILHTQVISRWFYNIFCLFGSGQIKDTAKKEESRKGGEKMDVFKFRSGNFALCI